MRKLLLLLLIRTIFGLLRFTWRFDEEAFPVDPSDNETELKSFSVESTKIKKFKPVVFAHWHGDEWPLLGAFAGRNMAVLVSESSDGSLMSSFLQKLGFVVARGSSSKGAVKGFLSLLRLIRKEKVPLVSLAVDGPRGPRHVPKEGVFGLAKAFGGGIVVATVAMSRAWTFEKSWSKAQVPKPFARLAVRYEFIPAQQLEEASVDEKQEILVKAFARGQGRAETALQH